MLPMFARLVKHSNSGKVKSKFKKKSNNIRQVVYYPLSHLLRFVLYLVDNNPHDYQVAGLGTRNTGAE